MAGMAGSAGYASTPMPMYGRVPVADLFCSVVPSAVFARFGAMLQLEGAEAAALQVSHPTAQRRAEQRSAEHHADAPGTARPYVYAL